MKKFALGNALGALVVLACVVPPSLAGAAGGHSCPNAATIYAPQGISALTMVKSVRGMTCGAAVSVVARHKAVGSATFQLHGTFMLGRYRSRVYEVGGEGAAARCAKGSRAFRISYGA